MPHAEVSHVEERSCACRSVDYLLSRQLEDGNFPQLASDQEKHVVHWCHGAPGLTALCCEAFRAFNDSKYLAIARRCCDVCWHRGILKKGFGLCHGIAGNAYSFLSVCRIEGADTESMVASKQYRRASCFARILLQAPAPASDALRAEIDSVHTAIGSQPDKQRFLAGSADFPFSLFEGRAGEACFLADMLDPASACFPAYEIDSAASVLRLRDRVAQFTSHARATLCVDEQMLRKLCASEVS